MKMAAPLLKTLTSVCKQFQKLSILSKTNIPNSNPWNGSHMKLFSTSSVRWDLMEFFDDRSQWGESSVKVGRPWKKDELRLKGNSDLHKLWYVLLKERNMIMTMEAEYVRQCELFPNPERLEKVEESMENILDVIAERDRAVNLLETGETGEPGRRWAYNELGIGGWRKCRENYFPIHMNTKLRQSTSLSGPWQNKWLRLMREKRLKQRRKALSGIIGKHRNYKKMFPHAELEVDLDPFVNTITKTMKGPKE